MIDIRPAQSSDRDAVLRFLRSRNKSDRPFDRLFDYRWHEAGWNFGYLIAQGGEVRGYIGHVYSRRSIRSHRYRFANQTSWSVDPEFRKYSLDLFHASLSEPDVVVTNFSANDLARPILEAYKFRRLDDGKCIVSPHHGYLGKIDLDAEVTIDRLDLLDQLGTEDRRIVEMHLPLGCLAYAPMTERGRALIIVLRRRYKGIPYADVLHCSAPVPDLLALGANLMVGHRVVALGLPPRFFAGHCLLAVSNRRATYYRSDSLQPIDIDALYSEFPLLYGAK